MAQISAAADGKRETGADARQEAGVPVLDQGTDGACAGFGLATVGNYLLRTRKIWPDTVNVSPWMLYQMAQQSDPHDASAGYGTPNNPDVGASCRSAVKGWNQNGVCRSNFWAKTGPCKPVADLVGVAIPDVASTLAFSFLARESMWPLSPVRSETVGSM